MLLLASKQLISVLVIALTVAVSHSDVEGENLQPRLGRWRDHSTAISGSAAQVLIASGCLPILFRDVEIDGEAYCDGGYAGNPTITLS